MKLLRSHKAVDSFEQKVLSYLSGKLSGKEQHAFEKELMRDPFAEEAMEGFENISTNELTHDIELLNKAISERAKEKHSKKIIGLHPQLIRIAASIILLFTIAGIGYFTFRDDNFGHKELAVAEDIKTPKKEKTAPAESALEPKPEKFANELGTEKTVEKKMPAAPSDLAREEVEEQELVIQEDDLQDLDAEIVYLDMEESKQMELNKTTTQHSEIEMELAEEEITSTSAGVASGSHPATETNKVIRSAEYDYAEKDYNARDEYLAMAKSEQPQASPQQGFTASRAAVGSKKKSTAPPSAVSDKQITTKPVPEKGYDYLENYIKKNIALPKPLEEGKSYVVKLKLSIDQYGEISKIDILESPGEGFSKESERLLKESPAWSPANNGEQNISDSVEYRIDFGKYFNP